MRKRLVLVVLISVTVLSFIIYHSSFIEANSDTIIITGDVVNVRQQPGTSSSILTQLHKGETYQVEKEEAGWYQIKLPSGEKGWIADWLAEKQVDEQRTHEPENENNSNNAKVTVNGLNIRTEPNISASVIGQLNEGDHVEVMNENNGWSQISFQSTPAWVSSKYLTMESPKNSQASDIADNKQIKVLYDETNIRKKPTLKSKIMKQAAAGDKFTILDQSSDWLKIELDHGKIGYIANWVVSTNNEQSNSDSQYQYIPGAKLVVIDPGHGGRDQGAAGVNGSLEKDLTMDVGSLLANKLYKAGFNVILTRSWDEYISLQDRVQLAETNKAAAFISLHYDSIEDRSIKGHTSYFYHEQDKLLATSIHSRISKTVSLHDRGIRFGNYYVLRENSRPSVLLELGFLSNSTEADIIASSQYKKDVAEAIFAGVVDYFQQ